VLDIVGINSTLQMAAEMVKMLALIIMVGQGRGVLSFTRRAARHLRRSAIENSF
jgi:hypothetical protein